MKILQFGFNGDSKNPYLPENIKGNAWVVYTGTHDNPTTLGWWNSLDIQTKERINQRSNSSDSPVWKLLEMGLQSEAKLVVAPIQDLLSLDNEARFNTPGTTKQTNWSWRLNGLDIELSKALKTYGERGAFWGRSLEGSTGLFNS